MTAEQRHKNSAEMTMMLAMKRKKEWGRHPGLRFSRKMNGKRQRLESEERRRGEVRVRERKCAKVEERETHTGRAEHNAAPRNDEW